MTKYKCEKCGKELSGRNPFCNLCGGKVITDTNEETKK